MKCRLVLMTLALNVGGSALGQVNLPQGFEIVEFAVNDKKTNRPAINNCGEIVYVKDRFENSRVYLYDNGKITRLTEFNNGLGVVDPDINDDGTVVWVQGPRRSPEKAEIVMLRDGKRKVVGKKGEVPSINSSGHMSWDRFRGFSCNVETDVIYFDGKRKVRITRDRFDNQSSRINDDDWIAWTRYDFCVAPWAGEIHLYRNGREIVLPSGARQSQVPTINNSGKVAWLAGNGIEVWEKGVTRLLTDWGGNPYLNNLGDIYFYRWHDEQDSTDAWLYRVSDGEPSWHRLTEDPLLDSPGDINDWTEATWRFIEDPYNPNWPGGVRHLRRIRTGDAEFDGDLDLIDYRAFVECMTGPGRVDRLCDCRFLDIDHDGDVDLADFSWFQNRFTGQ